MKRPKLKTYSDYKANFLFEYQIPGSYSEHQRFIFNEIFLDSIMDPLTCLDFPVIVMHYSNKPHPYMLTAKTSYVVFLAIAAQSKYRSVLKWLVTEEIFARKWKLCHFYDKSHSFLGGLRRFRSSVSEDHQIDRTLIQARYPKCTLHSTYNSAPIHPWVLAKLYKSQMNSSDLRQILKSVYRSTAVDWKEQKKVHRKKENPLKE